MQKANDEEEEQEAKKKKKGKKIVEGPHSIEKRVKVNKRGAEKPKDSSFEYNTPESISTKPLTIENVNCNTASWKSLDQNVKRHYRDWFNENKDQDKLFPYLYTKDLTTVVTKDDLKLIISHSDVVIEPLKAYMKLVKKEIEGTPQVHKVGFLSWEAVYFLLKHIDLENKWIQAGKEGDFVGCKFEIEKLFNDGLYFVFAKEKILILMHHYMHHHYSLFVIDNVKRQFIHMNHMRPTNKVIKDHWSMRDAMAVTDKVREFIWYINLNEALPDSEDTEDTREAAIRISQGDVIEEKRPMTEEEKETKNFIVENKITGELYQLISTAKCPQQDKLSVDCAPYVLHYMEEIANGRVPTKEGGNKMRKKMLEEFMKVKLENPGKLED